MKKKSKLKVSIADTSGISSSKTDSTLLSSQINKVLLDNYAPTGALVDNNLQILQFVGDSHPYLDLESGEASLKLSSMAGKGLMPDIYVAIEEVKKTNKKVRKTNIGFKQNGKIINTDLCVIPIKDQKTTETNFLILFEKTDSSTYANLPEIKTSNKENDKWGINRDITDYKQAEEELKESERLLTETQKSANMGSWEWNLQTGKSNWSEQLYKIYGRNPDLGTPSIESYLDSYHPDDKKHVQESIDTAINNDLPYEIEYRIFREDNGEERWISSNGALEKNADGKPYRLLGVAQDITKRKQAEEALLERDRCFYQFFKLGLIGMAITSIEKGWVEFNDTLYKMFGYSREEFAKKTWTELTYPDDLERDVAQLNRVVSGEINGYSLEKRFLHKDGSIFFAEISANSLRADDGSIDYFVALVKDITERKKAEENLKVSEDKFRKIFELSPVLMTLSDIETGLYFDVNNAFLNQLGYTREEVIGTTSTDLNIFLDSSARDGLIRMIKEKGFIQDLEFQIRRKSARIFHSLFSTHIVELTGKRFMLTTAIDITERKQVEEEIKESEKNLNYAQRLAKTGHWIWNPQNGDLFWSDELLRIFGEDLSFKPSYDTFVNSVHEDDKDLVIQAIEEALANIKSYAVDIRINPKTGGLKNVFIQGEVIFNNTGEPELMRGTVTDITDRKKSEEERALLEIQVRHSQKLETVGTLAGGIAHDFNNILTPIMGFTEMALINLKETDPLYDDLQDILSGAFRAKELVAQILLFAKQSEKEWRPLSLQNSITEALKLLRPTIPTTVQIQQLIDDSCGKILADTTQMHQVIVNLCTNAWQAMEKNGGKLTIELKQKKVDKQTAKLYPNLDEIDYACLSIIDTGHGIDEQSVNRIFEPFFTTKEERKGTGLGLSVVHGIVQSHNGEILVYSEVGIGTTFQVYLPIIIPEKKISEIQSAEIPGGLENIIIVDDDATIAKIVKRMLENYGYKTTIFKSGLEVLKAFKQQPAKYDLMISDLTMPHMTGLDLADHLHNVNPDFPVIIMTGFGDSLTVSTKEKYDIKKVIIKPISIRELTVTVRKVLDK